MKKILSLLLLTTMIFSLFACSESDGSLGGIINRDKNNSKDQEIDESSEIVESSEIDESSDIFENSESSDDYFEESSEDEDFEESESEQIDFGTDINALLKEEISFKNGDFNKTLALFDGLIAEYPYQELYGIMDAYEKYLALPEYVSTHENYFADGVFTANELFDITKSNNDANGNYDTDDYVPDDELKYICEIMAPVLLDYGINVPEAEARLLSEKIETLQITDYTDFGNGYYSDVGNILGIGLHNKGKELYEHTIVHETQHFIQSRGQTATEKKGVFWNIGYTYKFTEDGDEPLFLMAFTECSAEMLAHNWFESRDYDVYEFNIVLIELLKTSSILDKNIESDSFEKLSYSPKIEVFFDYFGCQTQAEKEEVLNMICAVNYYCDFQSVGKYFRERYEEKYNTDYDEFKFRCELYNSLGQTLTKYFYRNLAEILENKTVTTEEVFTIMALYEHKLANSVLIADPEDIEDMLFLYQKAQTEFLKILSQKLGMSVEELQAAYDEFYTDAVLNASNVSFLSQTEAEFLQYTTDAALNRRFYSINTYIQKKFQ